MIGDTDSDFLDILLQHFMGSNRPTIDHIPLLVRLSFFENTDKIEFLEDQHASTHREIIPKLPNENCISRSKDC